MHVFAFGDETAVYGIGLVGVFVFLAGLFELGEGDKRVGARVMGTGASLFGIAMTIALTLRAERMGY